MFEHWREHLYFLGFLSSIAFGGRFLLQWITSEIKQKSVVPSLFWRLSLIGNLLLLTHSFIQMQFHVVLVQACNAVISWRNLNLLQPLQQQVSFKKMCLLLLGSMSLITLLFLTQAYFISNDAFFRVPVTPWNKNENSISFLWHGIGFTGLILFNSRFWVQWWCSEKRGTSYMGALFWWISLIGDSLCLVYFSRLGDPVNVIGPLFGLIPYIRNLMLIHKAHKSTVSESTP